MSESPQSSEPATTDTRFARHEGLPGWRQEALAEATAVICGMGALGNEVAKNLGLAGIGRLIVCDPDTVERTNLCRTVLFGERDVGRLKVEAAAEALARLAPQTVVDPRATTLTAGVGLAELRDSSVVLGCLDSRQARLELLGRCALVDAPLVDGGTGPWSGEVRVRVAADEPCYGCTLTPRERAIADLPAAYTALYPDGDLSASIALTALVGAWTSMTALRLLFGDPPEYRMLRIEGLSGATFPVELTRSPGCPHHHPLGTVDLHVPVSPSTTVGDFLKALDAEYLVETWAAFPAHATCHRCGPVTGYHRTPSVPDGGTAPAGGSVPEGGTVREGGLCMQCGAPIRLVSSFRLPDASRSDLLSDLGVAPREILPARGADGIIRLVELSESHG